MVKYVKRLALVALVLAIMLLAGCSLWNGAVYVTSIEQTASDGQGVTYTVYYSDGTTSTFSVENGADGKDGKDGADGKDGSSITIDEIYEKYVEEYGEISYRDFLALYFADAEISETDTSLSVAQCLLSSMKIYTEFVETSTFSTGRPGQSYSYSEVAVYTGAAVIWSIDEDEDGYTYIVTNYHVVYDADADADLNGGALTARSIYAYLYGSESSPYATSETDENGCTVYEYGNLAVECEYVGGSVVSDIAVLRAKTAALTAINEDIRAVTLADAYYVGQTAIAIGNPEDAGISVTQGIVSIDNEYISLNIDGASRSYRSIRIDTALYSGNSGGGLYNADGKLIGITNAGDSSDQNINYAVPLEIVKGTVNNILYYFNDGDSATSGAYKITVGITVTSQNSKYVYDSVSGYGNIVEETVITDVTSGSIASQLGFEKDDVVTGMYVNGTAYAISRYFNIGDLLLTVRAGDSLQFVYLRDGEEATTSAYTVASSDLAQM